MTTNPQDINSGPTATAGPEGREPSQYPLARRAALRTIARLQAGYRKDVPAAVAAVARLRREAGRQAHDSPTSWGLDDLEDLAFLREEERKASEETAAPRPAGGRWHETQEAREDEAVHLAVTLWALHQQALRDEPMHVAGWTLGRAVRQLAQGGSGTESSRRTSDSATSSAEPSGNTDREDATPVEDVSPTIRKRFVRIGTATDFDMLGGRLREMVTLLRGARIPLDYGLLADQLNRWQDQAQQGVVRRAWGRDFHRAYAASGPADQSGRAA
jgi:CRISPR system Cascade subunit CasB